MAVPAFQLDPDWECVFFNEPGFQVTCTGVGGSSTPGPLNTIEDGEMIYAQLYAYAHPDSNFRPTMHSIRTILPTTGEAETPPRVFILEATESGPALIKRWSVEYPQLTSVGDDITVELDSFPPTYFRGNHTVVVSQRYWHNTSFIHHLGVGTHFYPGVLVASHTPSVYLHESQIVYVNVIPGVAEFTHVDAHVGHPSALAGVCGQIETTGTVVQVSAHVYYVELAFFTTPSGPLASLFAPYTDPLAPKCELVLRLHGPLEQGVTTIVLDMLTENLYQRSEDCDCNVTSSNYAPGSILDANELSQLSILVRSCGYTLPQTEQLLPPWYCDGELCFDEATPLQNCTVAMETSPTGALQVDFPGVFWHTSGQICHAVAECAATYVIEQQIDSFLVNMTYLCESFDGVNPVPVPLTIGNEEHFVYYFNGEGCPPVSHPNLSDVMDTIDITGTQTCMGTGLTTGDLLAIMDGTSILGPVGCGFQFTDAPSIDGVVGALGFGHELYNPYYESLTGIAFISLLVVSSVNCYMSAVKIPHWIGDSGKRTWRKGGPHSA